MLDAFRIFGPLLLGAAINLVAAVVTIGGRMRRGLGVVLALASMLPAWLVPPEHSLIRAIWVIVEFIGAARTIDLARGQWRLGDRLFHVISVVDSRRLVRAPPAFDKASFLKGVAWEALAWPFYGAILLAAQLTGPGFWVARWFLALVFVYALTEGAYRWLHAGYRAIGFVTPPLHIAPAASRSVQEFWGERWNRTVSLWLGETFFRPLARKRHPVLGSIAAFVASALVHAYMAWVSVSFTMALVMLAYFLTQAVIIGLERVLRVRSWSTVAGHAWAITWMVALSPLFIEPMMRSFGL